MLRFLEISRPKIPAFKGLIYNVNGIHTYCTFFQELVKYVIAAGKPQELQKPVGQTYRDDPTIFFLEVLIQIVIQNR